jgi:hypothetical protein
VKWPQGSAPSAPRSLNFGRVLGKEVKWPQGSAPSAPRSLNFGRVLWKGSEMATRLGAFGASLT